MDIHNYGYPKLWISTIIDIHNYGYINNYGYPQLWISTIMDILNYGYPQLRIQIKYPKLWIYPHLWISIS